MNATDPSGHVWRVSRRWVPWARRAASGTLPGEPWMTIIAVSVVLLLLLAPLVVLALILTGQVLLFLLLIPVAALVRMVAGRRWLVEVRRGWTPWTEVLAGDWRACSPVISRLAYDIERGNIPERSLGSEPPVR